MTARRLLPLLLPLLAACHPPKPVERPYAPPKMGDVVAALQARSARLRSLRAAVRVEHLENGERVKLGMDLFVARGGKMRFEAHVPLQGTVATLVADGQVFSLLDVKNNRFLTGPARGCNVARLLRVELEPDEVVRAILGDAPGIDHARPVGLDWDPSHGGREVLTMEVPDGGRERLFLDGREQRWDLLAAERLDAAGRPLWRVEDDGWQDQAGIRLPQRIHLQQPPLKIEVWIKFKEVELNVEPRDGVFRLEAPAGIKVENVDC